MTNAELKARLEEIKDLCRDSIDAGRAGSETRSLAAQVLPTTIEILEEGMNSVAGGFNLEAQYLEQIVDAWDRAQ